VDASCQCVSLCVSNVTFASMMKGCSDTAPQRLTCKNPAKSDKMSPCPSIRAPEQQVAEKRREYRRMRWWQLLPRCKGPGRKPHHRTPRTQPGGRPGGRHPGSRQSRPGGSLPGSLRSPGSRRRGGRRSRGRRSQGHHGDLQNLFQRWLMSFASSNSCSVDCCHFM